MSGTDPDRIEMSPEVDEFLRGPLGPYYGGFMREPVGGGAIEVSDPSSGRHIATVGRAGAADTDRAVAAARGAHDEGRWSRLKPRERERCMWGLAELIDRDMMILAQIDSLDAGRPYHLTLEDMKAASAHFGYYAGWCTKLEGRTHPSSAAATLVYSIREPVGVVGLITPWNYPLLMATWKLAPALAAGNCVVLKPAEQTPLSALYLTRLVEEAGFPPGVLNVLPGFGEEAGAALVDHPGVDKIGFTGSREVARSIVRGSAGNLKRISLELGGKSPNIVFADADLDLATTGATHAIFANTGQSCTAGSRLYLERSVYDRVLAGMIDETSRLRVGPGLAAVPSDLGPLVSSEHLDRVLGWVDAARASGAVPATGGARMGGSLADGYFVAPTILVQGTDEMAVCREEVFGPVVAAMPFEDVDEVVARANDTEFGLAAGVWTRDLHKAHALVSRLHAGTVWVNTWGVTDPAVPFGGMRQSGYGREMGEAALDLYTETKSVWVGAGS